FLQDAPLELRSWHQRRAREMFRFAELRSCRHQALVRLLGETMEPCASSCDVCLQSDIAGSALAKAPAPRVSFGRRAEAPASAAPRGAVFFPCRRPRGKKLAGAGLLPAYMIFSDATLLEMAARRPKTEDELRGVSGVGPKKLVQYGEAFLAEIAAAG